MRFWILMDSSQIPWNDLLDSAEYKESTRNRWGRVKTSNKHIYVYEDDEWTVRGCFETAQNDTDPIQWTLHNNKYVLPLLLVSFLY